MDPAIKKLAEKICRSETTPMLIVDDMLCCVYSSCPKVVRVGTLLSIFIKEPIEIPLKKERDTIMVMNNVSYCVRFIPIDKKYSFCNLLSFSDILTMAAFTDMYNSVEQVFSLMRECSHSIRSTAKMLEDSIKPTNKIKHLQLAGINGEALKLEYMLNSVSDYVYTSLSSNEIDEIIDTHALVEWLVQNANSVLEESGRAFDFITDVDGFFIRTNHRYAIISILHALQNAMIHSPIDDVPIVSLTKSVNDGKNYVVVQIVNKIESFTDTEEPDFVCRRCGLGIPVIKKFVQRADGDFFFKKSGSKAKVGIMIPEVEIDKNSIVMESGGFSLYDFGGRNIVLEMMQDAISTFSRKKKRH